MHERCWVLRTKLQSRLERETCSVFGGREAFTAIDKGALILRWPLSHGRDPPMIVDHLRQTTASHASEVGVSCCLESTVEVIM